MNNYNEKWTKEKHIEYRQLKKSGYSEKMLIEHFGDDIYESGLYKEKGASLPIILMYDQFITEIKVNPEMVDYSFFKQPSRFFSGESDYLLSFFSNDVAYIIALVYFPINNKVTYNLIFTTRNQWLDYEYNLVKFIRSGMTEDKFKILDGIIGKETGLNDIFPIFRKISWILLDFYKSHLAGELLSIGDTNNEKKIKIYRNIIKDSFVDIIETEENIEGYKYYIYKLSF